MKVKPIPVLIAQFNTHLIGLGAYFGKGYPERRSAGSITSCGNGWSHT